MWRLEGSHWFIFEADGSSGVRPYLLRIVPQELKGDWKNGFRLQKLAVQSKGLDCAA